jgi:NAD(P)-dependent dehydrogenase (short-subunit alcohol dehydrogenase family)
MPKKIALITGANKGIGFETARQLAAQDMTALVGARDEERGRAAERALRDGGADARFVRLDVTDPKSVIEAAAWIDAEYGRLDVLVNNAGIPSVSHGRALPSQTELDDMRAVYEINVFGVVTVTNAMLRCCAGPRPRGSSTCRVRSARSALRPTRRARSAGCRPRRSTRRPRPR